MDEPREWIGTILDVDDGNDASITLNAPIKITKEKIDIILRGNTYELYRGDILSVAKKGIISFETISDLGYILDNIISEEDYLNRLDSIKHNLEGCKKYRIAEDWIFENFLKKKGLV